MNERGSEPGKAPRVLAALAAALIAAGGGAVAVSAIAADGPTVRGDIYSPECKEAYLQTLITDGPKKQTSSSKATLDFKAVSCADHSVKYKNATFACSLDGSKFKDCKAPKTYRNLKKGKHKFRVAGVLVGTTDPTPAKRKWKVKG